MEIPDLFDEVYVHLVEYWSEKIKKADDMGYIENENEIQAKLKEKLDEETMKLAKRYVVAVECKVEHIYYEVCRHLFFFAVKAGMDMQKAFDKER